MEVWIISGCLLMLAFHSQPSQCYEDITSTISKTVTTRPLVFGTVYDETPSATPEAPFKPSKQLFNRIYSFATTDKPPDSPHDELTTILQPTNTRLRPSEALHINMYTIPTDSLNYNILLAQHDTVGVDNLEEPSTTPPENPQESALVSNEPIEDSSEGSSDEEPVETLVKKEVHYHQHKHFHGYDHLQSQVPENSHEQKKELELHPKYLPAHDHKQREDKNKGQQEPVYVVSNQHFVKLKEEQKYRKGLEEKKQEHESGKEQNLQQEHSHKHDVRREHSHKPEHSRVREDKQERNRNAENSRQRIEDLSRHNREQQDSREHQQVFVASKQHSRKLQEEQQRHHKHTTSNKQSIEWEHSHMREDSREHFHMPEHKHQHSRQPRTDVRGEKSRSKSKHRQSGPNSRHRGMRRRHREKKQKSEESMKQYSRDEGLRRTRHKPTQQKQFVKSYN